MWTKIHFCLRCRIILHCQLPLPRQVFPGQLGVGVGTKTTQKNLNSQPAYELFVELSNCIPQTQERLLLLYCIQSLFEGKDGF